MYIEYYNLTIVGIVILMCSGMAYSIGFLRGMDKVHEIYDNTIQEIIEIGDNNYKNVIESYNEYHENLIVKINENYKDYTKVLRDFNHDTVSKTVDMMSEIQNNNKRGVL